MNKEGVLMSRSLVVRPSILYYGTPVALISSLNPDGSTNLAPNSASWALADRVVLGLEPTAQTLANFERHPECIINLPSPDLWRQVEKLARTTGREAISERKLNQGYFYEPRKFEFARLTPVASEMVRPARVAECPLQLEARVVAIRRMEKLDEHDRGGGLTIVETRVLRVHAHENIVVSGTEHIDPVAWRPLFYVFRRYFGPGPSLGRDFKDETAHSG